MDLASAKFENLDRGGVHVGSHGNDKGLWVEFSMEAVYQAHESEKENRPIYKEVPFISIDFPGDKTKRVKRPVNLEASNNMPSDADRFPLQYAAFKAQAEQVQSGTPITEWAPIGKSQAMEFKAMKIHTVEQLASLPDTALTWLGGRNLRDKAVAWLAQAKDGSAISQIQAENADLKIQLQAMRSEINALGKEKRPYNKKKDKDNGSES